LSVYFKEQLLFYCLLLISYYITDHVSLPDMHLDFHNLVPRASCSIFRFFRKFTQQRSKEISEVRNNKIQTMPQ